MSFDVTGIGAVADFAGKLVDKFVPDPQAKATAQLELDKMLQNGELAQLAATTELAKLAVEDRGSARAMQIATRSVFPAILSSGITLGFFGVLGWMLYDPSVINSPPLLIMLGSLTAAFGGVVAYWLGSTNSSHGKDVLLAQSVPVK